MTWGDIVTPEESPSGLADRMPSSFSAVPGVTICCHRGGSSEGPESTMDLYDQAAAISGVTTRGALECDLHVSADGTLVMWHDTTVDPSETSIGTNTSVSAIDDATWPTITVDAVAGLGPSSLSFFSDLLDTYGGVIPLIIETKIAATVTPLISAIQAAGRERDVVIQSFTRSRAVTAAAAGIPSMVLYANGAAPDGTAMDALVTDGIEYIGISRSEADVAGICTLAHSKGIKVWAWTATSTAHYETLVADGIDGVFTDVPTATFALEDVPAEPTVLLGAWVDPVDSETTAQAITRFETACGPIQVARVYDGGSGPAAMVNAAEDAGLGSRSIVCSFKPTGDDATSYLDGSMDAAVSAALTDLTAQRNGHTIWVIIGHEPDVNWGSFGGAGGTMCKYGLRTDTKSMFARFHDKVQEHGDPGIIDSLCMVGYDFSNRIDTFYTQGQCSHISVDPYFLDNGLTMQEVVTSAYINIYDWVTTEQIPWGLAETGVLGPPAGTHDGTVSDIVSGIESYTWLLEGNAWPPTFVCQFNEDKFDGAMRIDNIPTAAAAFTALPRAT